MGAGYHGGFGRTKGAIKAGDAIGATSTFVGEGPGEALKRYAKKIPEEPGYTDVVMHGTATDVQILHHGKWVKIDQRRLAKMLKQDAGYKSGPIRLISCSTGKLDSGFAQNLANKMGVKVKAPSDTLWVFPNGKTVIGPSQWKNTGHWIEFKPKKKKG